jgi:hypothetical protein
LVESLARLLPVKRDCDQSKRVMGRERSLFRLDNASRTFAAFRFLTFSGVAGCVSKTASRGTVARIARAFIIHPSAQPSLSGIILLKQNKSPFKWRHFEPSLILLCVRRYCRYQLSYSDVEEMMRERGLDVDHSTVFRAVLQTLT